MGLSEASFLVALELNTSCVTKQDDGVICMHCGFLFYPHSRHVTFFYCVGTRIVVHCWKLLLRVFCNVRVASLSALLKCAVGSVAIWFAH